MVSEKTKDTLREMFGDHDYSYEMSDYNLLTLIENEKPKNYEELEKCARSLEEDIRYIKKMQEEMKA